MKSQQQEQHNYAIRTSCKHCIFAIYDEKTQTGCAHDRVKKWKSKGEDYVTEAYDLEKNFYVINKFCNFYRDARTWNDGKLDINKAQEEAKVTFDILLNCDDIDSEYSSWIQSFASICDEYGESKCFFHVYHKAIIAKQQRKYTLDLFKNRKNSNISVYFDKDNFQDMVLSKSKKSYHIDISKNIRPSLNILSDINDSINNKLHKLLVIKNRDAYVYSNLSYKIERENLSGIENIRNKILDYSKNDFYLEIEDE